MSTPTEFPASFVTPWKELLQSHSDEQQDDFPNHHVDNADSLITVSCPKSIYVGTGFSIYLRAILPAILAAKHSVQLITCYWADSDSLDAIRRTLEELVSSRQGSNAASPLRISIGFSSWGLLQKLFHTSSRDGYVYPPSKWTMLGLPDEAFLKRGGVELTVKSLFFTPLSVMHPKFVVVDGKRAWIPSCNVSWERWFEGCVEVEGDVIEHLLGFYERVWAITTTARDTTADALNDVSKDNLLENPPNRQETESPLEGSTRDTQASYPAAPLEPDGDEESATRSFIFSPTRSVPTIILPSPHHRNPRFSFFPFLSQSNPPMTPLNAALLTLFANAQRQITILTPNFTSWPVLEALLDALARGVDVRIRTSKNMMLIEQLITAGTTTSWCLTRFIQQYKSLLCQPRRIDPESMPLVPGKLDIFYYKQLDSRRNLEDEPVVSHFKMTLVDEEYLVMGSGNMDRASWWTSQELGLLFYLPDFKGQNLWEDVLQMRTEVLFQSSDLRT
ncbi:hypothetical protein G7046_g1330 [Stylonectria norvegica]|nr:hypothetical protein G7046_g1330 [Stylonectria norvegica]